ncbi:MAG TPA: hypothetical protein V6C81_17645 [Planktothrix sp.]|jgi:hypothetical protein
MNKVVPIVLGLVFSAGAAMADEMTLEKNTVVPGVGASSSSTTIVSPEPVAPAPATVSETKTKHKWHDFFGNKHVSKTKTETVE